MTATYTWDVFSTLDGYGSYGRRQRLGRLLEQAGPGAARAPRRLVRHRAADGLRATTFRENAAILTSGIDPDTLRRVERPDDAHAGDGDVLHAGGHPRLAGRDHRER